MYQQVRQHPGLPCARGGKTKNRDETVDIQTLRKKNLKKLIEQWDGPTVLAKKLNYSGPSYLSQLIGPSKPVTEKTARRIEEQVGLPPGWLDSERPERRASGGGDSAMLTSVALRVMADVAEAGVTLSPVKMSELLTLAWERAAERGGVDDEFIKRIVRMLKED